MSSSRFVDNLHFFEGQPSATLEDLFRRVGDAHSDRKSDDSPPHCAVELEEEISSTTTSLPPPFVLKFTNLTYTIKTPTNKLSLFPSFRNNRLATAESIESALNARKKTVLGSISGEARDGEIMAVLGASGSGKSTLIDALAGRISRASLQGSVTLNGEDLLDGRHLLKTISAYVMQDDLLYPMLTVEETLMFAAEFRLPRSLSHSKKKARVQVLIDQLGLRAAANTVIGDEGHRGVSGGERRRVSIGTDIIHDPIVLFLDEPTSGLDSTSAFMVVKVLQRIARNGSVVVLSIHQPSFRILGLLDRLLFLSRGKTVYGGTPDGLHPFFAEFGHRIPDNENPAEFALDHIRELESTPSGAWPLVEFNNSRQLLTPSTLKTPDVSLKDAIAASISRGKLVSGGSASGSAFPAPSFANPFWVEMAVLSRRAFTNSRRLPELFCMRLGAVVVTGFILATIFWRLDDSPRGARERLGFFAIAMSTMFYTCADALPVFLEERYIYLRETAYNAYRRSSYVLSNAAVGVPSLALLSIAFTCTTFFAVGLAGGAQGFLYFFLIVFASFWAGSGFVTFLSGVVSHVMLGYTVVVAILAYFLLFSGFFIDRTRIPNYWIWFHYLSLVKYPYEGVLLNEFGEGDKCFARGTEMFDGSPLGSLPDATKAAVLKAMGAALGVNLTVETCVTTGADLLKQEAITQMGKWGCLCVTAAWGFLFRILFYFALMMRSNNKRK